MNRKTLIFLLLLSLPAGVFADKNDFDLLRKHTSGIIYFLNDEQNKQTFKQVDFKIPVKKIVSKGTKKKIDSFKAGKFDFSNKTAYGQFQVLVFEESENSFKVSFSSEYPIQRYQLTDTTTKNVTKEESLNDKTIYTFTVPKKFEAKYVLILSQFKDDFLSQNIIPLYNKAVVKTK